MDSSLALAEQLGMINRFKKINLISFAILYVLYCILTITATFAGIVFLFFAVLIYVSIYSIYSALKTKDIFFMNVMLLPFLAAFHIIYMVPFHVLTALTSNDYSENVEMWSSRIAEMNMFYFAFVGLSIFISFLVQFAAKANHRYMVKKGRDSAPVVSIFTGPYWGYKKILRPSFVFFGICSLLAYLSLREDLPILTWIVFTAAPVYMIFYGIYSYRVTRICVIPTMLLFFFELVCLLPLYMAYRGADWSGILFLLLIFILLPLVSSLVTRMVYKKCISKKEK